MNMNKLRDFTKKYGFYLAVSAVSIGAIVAVVMTSEEGFGPTSEVSSPATETSGTTSEVGGLAEVEDSVEAGSGMDAMPDLEGTIISGELVEDTTSSDGQIQKTTDIIETLPEEDRAEVDTSETSSEVSSQVSEEVSSETATEASSETSTEASTEQPFFAEGDTLVLPVNGEVIVPFRDDTTQHWFSTALQHTMRTYGVCISATEGETIKAPARGTIVDIVDDSTVLDSTKLVGDVGDVIIMDIGNGYQVEIGVQGGVADKDLLGQVVDASQVIATVGDGTGPFADLSHNVYMQVSFEGQAIDPTTLLSYEEEVANLDKSDSQE